MEKQRFCLHCNKPMKMAVVSLGGYCPECIVQDIGEAFNLGYIDGKRNDRLKRGKKRCHKGVYTNYESGYKHGQKISGKVSSANNIVSGG